MDEKWIFLLNMNKDANEKLCGNLAKIEKSSPPLGPPPLQSSISSQSHKTKESLGKRTNGFSNDKGMQTRVWKNGAQIN